MKLISLALLAFFACNNAWSADNIFGDPKSGNFQLKDNSGRFWNAFLADTTNGNGDIYTLGGLLAGDNIIGGGSTHLLIDNSGRRWPLSVWYTTDGAGNVIPISGGGGGAVTSVFGRTGAVAAQSGDYSSFYLLKSNNLSDLASASTARTNLGLGTAAVQASSFFLQSANNLSDLASASTARTNLGLGSAAVQASSFFLQTANNLSDLVSASTARTNLGLGSIATYAAPQVNKYFYVDGSRTDSYTADGSALRPFKTVGAAITQVITNGDNGSTAYSILIAPGNYNETLSFNSASLFNLYFASFGMSSVSGSSNVSIGTGTTAITSSSNNTQLASLTFQGINFSGAVNLTGDVNGTNFASNQFSFGNCQFNMTTGQTFVLNNINNVNFIGSTWNGSGLIANFTNVAFAYIEGVEGLKSGSTINLVQNNGGNQPSQAAGNYLLMAFAKFNGTMTIDAGSEWDNIRGYVGSSSTVTNNGTIHSFHSIWEGAQTNNNGSTTRVDGDVYRIMPTNNAGSTFTNRGIFPYMRLPVQGSGVTPTCGAGQSGALSLTSAFVQCVCNGTSWVKTADGTTACTF